MSMRPGHDGGNPIEWATRDSWRRLMRGWAATCTILAITLSSVSPGWAAGGPTTLQVMPPLAPHLAAMPRIAHPINSAQRRVNAALARKDAALLKARVECRGTPSEAASWTRDIELPMQGPHFLSIVVTDGTYCGGPHPNVETTAFVYDLRRGEPTNLATLLPTGLTKLPLQPSGTTHTPTLTLASPQLRQLFLTYYGEGDAGAETKDCQRQILQAADNGYPLVAWLDAAQRGLVMQPSLPRPVQNCAEPTVIPVAELRKQGASPDLLRALEASSETP